MPAAAKSLQSCPTLWGPATCSGGWEAAEGTLLRDTPDHAFLAWGPQSGAEGRAGLSKRQRNQTG